MLLSVKIYAAQRPCVAQVRAQPRGILAKKTSVFLLGARGRGCSRAGRAGAPQGHCFVGQPRAGPQDYPPPTPSPSPSLVPLSLAP